MKLPGTKVLLLIGVAGVLTLLTVVAVIADENGAAILCAVALQLLSLAVVLDVRRGQIAAAEGAAKHAEAMARLERQIDNVGLRVVTEAQALERTLLERTTDPDTRPS